MQKIIFDNNYPKLHNQKRARLLFYLNEIPGKILKEKFSQFLIFDTMKDDESLYKIEDDEVYMLLLFVGDKNIMFSTLRKQNKENSFKYNLSVGDIFEIEIQED